MFWVLVVMITLGTDDSQFTRIESFETRWSCEIMKDLFVEKYGPFQQNEEVKCLKVDD